MGNLPVANGVENVEAAGAPNGVEKADAPVEGFVANGVENGEAPAAGVVLNNEGVELEDGPKMDV